MITILIHKKNEGSAMARETGITLAKGKWIFFLDSDDCLDGADALKILAQRAEETGSDITVGNYRKRIGTRLTEKKTQHFFGMEDHKSVGFRFDGFTRDGHLSYEWGKLYRTAFLRENGIHHTPYPFTQDKAFNMKCFLAGANYAFVDRSVYLYRVNPDSVTFSYKKTFADVWIGIAGEFDKTVSNLPESEQMGDLCAAHLLLGLYYYGKQEIASRKEPLGKIRGKLKQYMRNPLVVKYAVLYKKENYGREFGSLLWRLFFDMFSFLIRRQWATAACLLCYFLLWCGAEGRISENAYRGDRGKRAQNA